MKRIFIVATTVLALMSCHENLEDRCVREAKEYTEKYCPTPVVNSTRTDSVTFDKATKTYQYFCSFVNELDNPEIVKQNTQKLHSLLIKEIKDNTSIKKLKEANYNFAYIIHSNKNPDKVLYQQTIRVKDYQ